MEKVSVNRETKVKSATGKDQGGDTHRWTDHAAMKSESNVLSSIVTITHSSNPVRKLSAAQLRKIATGDYTNWNQVGGLDQPINVFAVPNVKQLLQNITSAPLSAKANMVAFLTVLIPSVGQDKGAIGFLQVESPCSVEVHRKGQIHQRNLINRHRGQVGHWNNQTGSMIKRGQYCR